MKAFLFSGSTKDNLLSLYYTIHKSFKGKSLSISFSATRVRFWNQVHVIVTYMYHTCLVQMIDTENKMRLDARVIRIYLRMFELFNCGSVFLWYWRCLWYFIAQSHNNTIQLIKLAPRSIVHKFIPYPHHFSPFSYHTLTGSDAGLNMEWLKCVTCHISLVFLELYFLNCLLDHPSLFLHHEWQFQLITA